LNEAAYMAEIIRGGIGSVDKGQLDASHALGMNNLQLMRKVVLPPGHAGGAAANRQ
jgi:polar amino acid transport system permease protein